MARRRRFVAWVALVSLVVALPAAAAGRSDPLPSWRDGAARRALLRFVRQVTTPGSRAFVPPADRVATFDNDGTLLAEKPYTLQHEFVLERIRELAVEHPEWKETQPFQAVLEGDVMTLAGLERPALEEVVLAASAGITEAEYVEAIDRFLASYPAGRMGSPIAERVYRPMLELLHYLRQKGFKVFLCSAAGPELIRSYSERVYGIPRDRVIGSDMQMRFELRDGAPALVREPGFVVPTNERGGKPINLERVIGRSPILAFGNSDGDIEMLEFAAYGGKPHLSLLLLHDDEEREYAYDEGAQEALALASERGWIVVSMKQGFRRIFWSGKRR